MVNQTSPSEVFILFLVLQSLFVKSTSSKKTKVSTLFIISNTTGTKDDKLIEIVKALKGDYYLSGPAAKDYIVNEKFEKNEIKLAYIKYDYPEYNQINGEFNHFVTILDVIFNVGKEAINYIFTGNIEEIQ